MLAFKICVMTNLPSSEDRAPITIDTMDDFKRYGYSLAAYCDQCSRHHEFDIDELISNGHEQTSIVNFKPQCRECGNTAQKLVSPPRPAFTGYPNYPAQQSES